MPTFGTLDYERQLARVPRVEDLADEDMPCHSVETIVFAAEIRRDSAVESVPPALNPVLPPYARVEIRRHLDSPWGTFNTASLTIACRANGAACGYATGGFCDNDRVMEYLRLHYGARMKRAAISLEPRYFGIEGRVASEGKLILDALMETPEPIDQSEVLLPQILSLAKFEGQLWLIEEDKDYGIVSAERGMTLLRTFDPEAFGDGETLLRHPLPAVFIRSSMTYLPVGTLIDPALPASLGTRKITRPSS